MSLFLSLICNAITAIKRYKLHKKGVIDLPRLSEGEKEKIRNYYGRLGLKAYYTDWQIFKKECGFDARFVPDDMQIPFIIKSLNPSVYVIGFEHKGLYPIIYKDLKLPNTIVVSINGVMFDSEMRILPNEKCLELLNSRERVIVKPTSITGCGSGISVYESTLFNNEMLHKFQNEYKGNYIVQELVRQSEQMSVLSKRSLNTFRISTLFLNGKFSICSITCRCGMSDSYLDNVAAGNVIVGVNEDGHFMKYAYDRNYGKHTITDTDIEFSSVKIKNFERVKEFVKENHIKYLPHCGFVGWDIALDVNDEPVMIEVNLYGAGVHFEQLVEGKPLYGERTDEVLEYVKNHKPSIQSILTNWSWI